jgi:hypothetical protein
MRLLPQRGANDRISIWQTLFAILSSLPTDTPTALKIQLRQATELFESQILDRDLDDLPDPIAAKMRSYTTESHRLLRLLPMDVMFVAAARNQATLEQRRQAYQAKLDLLLQYCQAVMAVGE